MHSSEETKEAIKLANLYLEIIEDFLYDDNREKAIYTVGQIHGLATAASISGNRDLYVKLIDFLHIAMEKLDIS